MYEFRHIFKHRRIGIKRYRFETVARFELRVHRLRNRLRRIEIFVRHEDKNVLPRHFGETLVGDAHRFADIRLRQHIEKIGVEVYPARSRNDKKARNKNERVKNEPRKCESFISRQRRLFHRQKAPSDIFDSKTYK